MIRCGIEPNPVHYSLFVEEAVDRPFHRVVCDPDNRNWSGGATLDEGAVTCVKCQLVLELGLTYEDVTGKKKKRRTSWPSGENL
jgi:hypothetical protein